MLHSGKDKSNVVQLPEGVTPFVQITQNIFLRRKHKKLKEDDIAICECKYDASDPESACVERCLNVLTNTECTPGYCQCGEACRNQIFQKREYAKTKLFRTERRGWGLLADENIEAGQFIIEYCGEVISSDAAKKRSHAYEAHEIKDTYIISLDANYFIDSTRKGNFSRFINHSCQPNCETRKWTVLGETRVGIFAMQDILVGMELTINYYFEWYGGATVRCLCGAANCCIFLGAKSKRFQLRSTTMSGKMGITDIRWNQVIGHVRIIILLDVVQQRRRSLSAFLSRRSLVAFPSGMSNLPAVNKSSKKARKEITKG